MSSAGSKFGSVRRTFGTNYEGAFPGEPLREFALNVVDDLRRTIGLCNEAMHAEGDQDPIPSAVSTVLDGLYGRAQGSIDVLAGFPRAGAVPVEPNAGSSDIIPLADNVTENLTRARHSLETVYEHHRGGDTETLLLAVHEVHNWIGTCEQLLDEIRESARGRDAKSDVRAAASPEGRAAS